MNKYIIIILSLFLLSGCASKRYAKKAQKFEDAGLYEEAANSYYESLKANIGNIDSKLGLRKNGQLVLDRKLSAFSEAYLKSNTKDAVYAYIAADNYFKKIDAVGVVLTFPDHHKEYYKEVKDKYLISQYMEGSKALDLEDFPKAFTIFDEILKIDISYKDTRTKFLIAKFEPKYRDAIEKLDNGYFRSAYYIFEEITKEHSTYKDALLLKNEALTKATITIAVIPFYSSVRGTNNINETLQITIIKQIQKIKSPFYKVINNESINTKIKESKGRFFREKYDRENSQFAGSLLGVKTILTGKIMQYEEVEGRLEKTEKRGWEVYYKSEKVDSLKTVQVKKYRKVSYTEYQKKNEVTFQFQYELISTETGEILLTDVFSYEKTDEVHYAKYSGDEKKLIPGYWEYQNRTSPKDVKIEDEYKIKTLQALLKEKTIIESPFSMQQNFTFDIATKIAKDIEKYNPEE